MRKPSHPAQPRFRRFRARLPRALGNSGPYFAMILINALGYGLFAPFSVLYFHQVVSLSLPLVGLGLSLATGCWAGNDPTGRPAHLAGMYELFERTRATKHMVILRKADHGHFGDEIEQQAEFCSREQAHLFVRGLTLCHMDAHVRQEEAAQRFWSGGCRSGICRAGRRCAGAQALRRRIPTGCTGATNRGHFTGAFHGPAWF